MTDYRLVMSLLLQDRSYRGIEAIAGCSHRTVAKAKKVCREHGLTAAGQVEALSVEEIDVLFADGRKTPSAEFVAIRRGGCREEAHGQEQAAAAGAVGQLPR